MKIDVQTIIVINVYSSFRKSNHCTATNNIGTSWYEFLNTINLSKTTYLQQYQTITG